VIDGGPARGPSGPSGPSGEDHGGARCDGDLPPATSEHPRRWRNTLIRRARIAAAETLFQGLAGLASLHPAASPRRHAIEVERDVVYGPDPRWHRLDLYRPARRPGP
jgi:hypothetical protein